MGFLKNIRKSLTPAIAVVALTLSYGVASAAPPETHLTTAQMMDRAQCNTLLGQVSGQLAVVRDSADTLRLFVQNPLMYSKQEYANYLNDIKVAVNKAQEDISNLQGMKAKLSPIQIETVAKVEKDLNSMARKTESLIEIFDHQGIPVRLENTAFPKELSQVYDLAVSSHRIARDYLTWSHDNGRSKQALRDLEKSS